MGMAVRLAVMCSFFVMLPSLSAAQPAAPARLTIGASGGVSNPLHGDLQFTAASWDVSVRAQGVPHMMVEGFASQWRHSEDDIRTGVPLTGPNGPLGRIGTLTIEDRTYTDVFGFSFLPTFTAGAVTVAGGGGPALMVLRHDYAQRLSGCEPASLCRDYETQHTATTFAVALAGTVDVRLASRWLLFVQARGAIPTEDPGSGHLTTSAGVRFVLW